MVGDQFTFSWDHYYNDVPNTFKQLWQNLDFADVTLATKDGLSGGFVSGGALSLNPWREDRR